MPLYIKREKQELALSKKDAWRFFSNPHNLALITPKKLGFKILSENLEDAIYPGMLISYQVTPLLGIAVNWVTEITALKEECYFIDEQRIGPYKFWHHTHFIHESANGVIIEDLIHYALPFGPLGALLHRLIVKKKIDEIFAFRRDVLEKKFIAVPKSFC